MLFQPAIAMYSLMKSVTASQNLFLDSTGFYGCHEKVSFRFGGSFHGAHKFPCFGKNVTTGISSQLL